MLGAQARAAEYNAPKNLSARQASREAEEQKLPPKPAPISLGAFTRNPSVNRNKGAKHYVPLVLAEQDEEDETLPEETQSTVSSKDHSASSEPKQSTPSAPRSTASSRIRVNLPRQGVIPIAPRAMRFQVGQPTLMPAAQVPQMPGGPQPQVQDYHGFIPMALYPGQPGPQTVGMYPYHYHGWMAHSHGVNHTGHSVDNTPEGMRRVGPMLAPTDMTPTKQEQKLSMMSQAYRNPLFVAPDGQSLTYEQAMASRPHYVHPAYPEAYIAAYNGQAVEGLSPPARELSSLHRPDMHHAQPDFTPEPRTAVYEPQPSLHRHNSVPELSIAPTTPPRSLNSLLSIQTHPALTTSEHEEPYDRNLNVKNFLSQPQQTGKTVLHNPDLHKTQEAHSQEYTEQMEHVETPSKPAAVGDKFETTRASAAPGKPPGLEEIKSTTNFDSFVSDSTSAFHSNPPQYDNQRDNVLHDVFEVGGDDWFELRPATASDRHLMQSVMSFVALDMESQKAVGMSSVVHEDQRKETQAWLHSDPRGLTKVREEVEKVADEYSSRARGDGSSQSRDDDVQAGMLRGAGDIMAALAEYAAENSKKMDNSFQDYFNRTKKVPEYAVERREPDKGSTSLFETEGSGFYNAPHRISRDPRYRLQAREIKSEDNWAAPRYDLFGRRKV